MKVGVIGGGLMGLALARRLAENGNRVSVFERGSQLGGLATHYDFGEFVWDRFYHVVLPSDLDLIRFLHDIGMSSEPRWETTRTGFFVDQQLYSVSNNFEFLKFPPLSLWSKFRLALTILYCSRIDDWRRLEHISVEDWLVKVGGRATYEKLWRPLLLAKLGENYRRVSAVFIWTYIKRMFSARDASAQKEQLGYISGGYKAVFERLSQSIDAAGGTIHTEVAVQRVASGPDGQILITHDQCEEPEAFDKVVFTGPVGVLSQVASESLISVDGDGRDVEYLGVICMALVTRKPLQPFYVLNIADSRVPFTGVIGMSNVVPESETSGLHLTYLPKYVHYEDPLLHAPDDELRESFLNGLGIMFPDLEEADIESVHINRATRVQPLQVIEYSRLIPSVRTSHENFYVLNTSQFVNNTLNNNEVIKLVEGFMREHGAAFKPGSEATTEPTADQRMSAVGT
ncbi:MAG: NAD(P)/FAD-dependent oxidoreductase [Gammaproteobacteria bacterium]|nr:NAD(P)/FAD-dependent oxidoreductase [Gammaproteobacteria bacterium]